MNCFRSEPKVPGKVVEEQAARRINANDITIMRINENLLNNMILCISFYLGHHREKSSKNIVIKNDLTIIKIKFRVIDLLYLCSYYI